MFLYLAKKILLNLVPEKYLSAINYHIMNKRLKNSLDIKSGNIIFDIGAHNGESIEMFINLKKNIIIHSFEPNDECFKKLENKYNNYKNIVLNNYAVTNKAGKSTFYINNHSTTSSFLKINRKFKYENFIFRNIKKKLVNTCKLDDYCKEKKIQRIDLLKIDVQGFEDIVLEGAKNLIKSRRIKKIILEIVLAKHYERSCNFYKIEKLLIKHGYFLKNLSSPAFCTINSKILWIDALYSQR